MDPNNLEELMKSAPKEFPPAGSKVAEADPDEVKAVFEYDRTLKPGTVTGWGVGFGFCKDSADIFPTSHRASMLKLLLIMLQEEKPDWVKDGMPDDAAFAAMARLPMVYPEVGVQMQGPPFDYEEFLRLVAAS